MKLTKYEHACFTLEKGGKLLVVDPGAYTTDLPALESVVGVIVTHEHADHYDPTALGAIISHSPEATIYALGDITRQFGNTLPHQSVEVGQTITAGPFSVEFLGGDHAIIHPDIPSVANMAILVNDSLYYPGDSFFVPKRPVSTLALPTAGPWMKMSETFDFLMAVKPKLAFPTHDAVASAPGKQLTDTMTPMFAKKVGATYQRIVEPTEIEG